MRRPLVSILVILALGVRPGPALCETPPIVAPDATVRVNALGKGKDKNRIVGTVVSVDDKTLVLRIDALSPHDEIPVAAIQSIEVRRPKRMTKKGALIGACVG